MLLFFIAGDRLRSTVAISHFFSKIGAFFNLGQQLVVLTPQEFNLTLQLFHLICLFLLFPLHIPMPMVELISSNWIIGLVDIATASEGSDVKGGTDKVPSDEGLVDSR